MPLPAHCQMARLQVSSQSVPGRQVRGCELFRSYLCAVHDRASPPAGARKAHTTHLFITAQRAPTLPTTSVPMRTSTTR